MRGTLPLMGAACGLWLWRGNRTIGMQTVSLSLSGLPRPFRGLTIAQVSDLHNAQFGRGNRRLLRLLKAAEPDLIALTGDLIDARRPRPDIVLAFARQVTSLAPTYYVPGNHEARLRGYPSLRAGLFRAGVTVLENRMVPLTRAGEQIRLVGLADPSFARLTGDSAMPTQIVSQELDRLLAGQDRETVTLLLSHRPELFPAYAAHGADLTLAGHTHGGQVRLPGLGGVIAPSQGVFPPYDSGVYRRGKHVMVVSRGLGNSLFPVRINNRPEVILVQLN